MNTNSSNTGIDKLYALKIAASFSGNTETATINGIVFTARYIKVERDCYYCEPVPTLQLKADGKRIAFNKALKMIA